MSFFKKLTKEFEGLKASFEEKDKKKEEAPKPVEQPAATPSPAFAAPPAVAPPTSGAPPLPAGWTAQWDQPSQRWFYVEIATGRSQWDLPTGVPAATPVDATKGAGELGAPPPTHGVESAHVAPPAAPPVAPLVEGAKVPAEEKKDEKKKDDDMQKKLIKGIGGFLSKKSKSKKSKSSGGGEEGEEREEKSEESESEESESEESGSD